MIKPDPKRTGVKATLIQWTEPPMELIDDKWFGPPGAFLGELGKPPHGYEILCCPGCGQCGTPKDGANWQAVEGSSFVDVATLTLTPSILKHCCGWHGYLKNGVFESC